jgi:hypothetical protein
MSDSFVRETEGESIAKQWPHNIKVEQALLGSLILTADWIKPVLEVIAGPDAFFRAVHAELFAYLREMHDAGRKIDLITVEEELKHRNRLDDMGGFDFLFELIERGRGVLAPSSAVEYAEIIREHARKRSILEGVDEIRHQVLANGQTADQLSDFVSRRLKPILSESAGEETGPNLRPWPDPLGDEAYQGIAGEVVRLIAPHTEADPAAILVQFLVGFGNLVGRSPHWRVESSRHGVNLYACITGNTSKARKGTSWDNVKWILDQVDRDWAQDQIQNGLSSGEGMIWAVRDAIIRRVKAGDGFTDQEVDPGIHDKRALWVESEFGTTLSVLARDGNSLNGVLRQGWDGFQLRSATKNNPARSNDAHISVIGHITVEDLVGKLTRTDAANGFANRFLWVCARRSQYLPHGGRIFEVDFRDIVNSIHDAARFARHEFADGVPLLRDAAANALWESVYPLLSEPRPGLLGAVTSRAEAQVMRLAAIYCLLDCQKWIQAEHLNAALTVWRYCEQSAAYIFGESMGDPVAENLLQALKDAGEEGLTLTQIRRTVFSNRVSADVYNDKLTILSRAGLAMVKPGPKSGGREVWIATPGGSDIG